MVKAGQRLKEARLSQKLTIEEVAKATKIRENFLSAIEKGDYYRLPSAAYAQGFVVNYAEFLGLPKKEILALFRREFEEDKVFKVLPDGLARKEEFSLNRLRLQQTMLVAVSALLLLIGYVLFQYRYAIINPPLQVSIPLENQIVQKDVQVRGKTDPNASITLNDEIISVESDGTFKKTITLFPGSTIIHIKAQNRFGNHTQIDRHIEIKE